MANVSAIGGATGRTRGHPDFFPRRARLKSARRNQTRVPVHQPSTEARAKTRTRVVLLTSDTLQNHRPGRSPHRRAPYEPTFPNVLLARNMSTRHDGRRVLCTTTERRARDQGGAACVLCVGREAKPYTGTRDKGTYFISSQHRTRRCLPRCCGTGRGSIPEWCEWLPHDVAAH